MSKRFLPRAVACGVALALAAGCQTQPPNPNAQTQPILPNRTMSAGSPSLSPGMQEATSTMGTPTPQDNSRIYRGNGVVVKGLQPGGTVPPSPPIQATGSGIVLNFEGADLREVVRNVLGDILNETYTIDPAVGGTVTIRTSSGIPRDALPATLETLLRMNGATMVKSGGIYMVVPQAAAVRGNVTPQLGSSTRALPPGFSVQIVPLRYVGVREMLRLLEPFAKDAQAVRPDELRNLLILSGTERELKHLMDTIDMFDIDWMAGMSAGVFPLQNSDVKSVMQELEKIVGDRNTSPLTGILKIVPIERMNALLVVSPQQHYIEEVKKWIDRLDKGGEGGGLNFYVYNLQNSRAERLGPLLQQAFTGRVTQPLAPAAPTLAPGTPAGSITNPPTFQNQTSGMPISNPTPPAVIVNQATSGGPPGQNQGTGIVRNLQVVADKDANTLLFVATAAEYSIIEAALKKLDVPQRQVVIDVTIAQIVLQDELEFGVEWLFKGAAPSGRGSGGLLSGQVIKNPVNPGRTSLPTASDTTTAALAKGFTYIINNSNFPGGIQAALNLLDTYGNTKIVANPQVAALDNQKATIKSGERIPINQSVLVGGTTNAVTTTSQYVDTGVLLQVTPHINSGGLVALDVQAEVSDPGTCTGDGCAPPINTRSIQTYVAVPSGQTMVMGGLINEGRKNSSEGIPLLSRIPLLGGLFGQQTLTNNRTELVLFITPRVVETRADIGAAIDELRRKMENIDALIPLVRPNIGPIFPDTVVPQLWQPFTSPPIFPPPPPPPAAPVTPPLPAEAARTQ
ncbi:MAG: type II secretion system secretin GspD [Burkholderiales bacterium]